MKSYKIIYLLRFFKRRTFSKLPIFNNNNNSHQSCEDAYVGLYYNTKFLEKSKFKTGLHIIFVANCILSVAVFSGLFVFFFKLPIFAETCIFASFWLYWKPSNKKEKFTKKTFHITELLFNDVLVVQKVKHFPFLILL